MSRPPSGGSTIHPRPSSPSWRSNARSYLFCHSVIDCCSLAFVVRPNRVLDHLHKLKGMIARGPFITRTLKTLLHVRFKTFQYKTKMSVQYLDSDRLTRRLLWTLAGFSFFRTSVEIVWPWYTTTIIYSRIQTIRNVRGLSHLTHYDIKDSERWGRCCQLRSLWCKKNEQGSEVSFDYGSEITSVVV
jgi:hypothetical protein